jgi:hypothetical protein
MKLATKSWTVVCAAAIIPVLLVPHSATAQNSNEGAQPFTSRTGTEVSANSGSEQIPTLPSGVRNAPESLNDGNSVFRLQAYIYRNFAPLATSQDDAGLAAREKHTSMIAIVTLMDEHGMPMPPTLHAEKIWVLQGESVWETSTIEERRNDTRCDFVVRDGPKWQPRSAVDVIVRLQDGNGKSFLLAIRHQAIGAVS